MGRRALSLARSLSLISTQVPYFLPKFFAHRKLRRLENIKRNNAVLASLGLSGSGNVLKSLEADKTKAKAAKVAKAKVAKALKAATRAKRKSWEVPASQRGQPMRVSKRIRAAQSSMAALPNDSEEDGEEGGEAEEGEEEEPAVDYTNTAPFDPSELDDDEFQVYVSVRCKCFGECGRRVWRWWCALFRCVCSVTPLSNTHYTHYTHTTHTHTRARAHLLQPPNS